MTRLSRDAGGGGGGDDGQAEGGDSGGTERRRKLKRDASSDPMREQTEPDDGQDQLTRGGGPASGGPSGGGSTEPAPEPEREPERDTSPGASGSGQGLDRGGGTGRQQTESQAQQSARQRDTTPGASGQGRGLDRGDEVTASRDTSPGASGQGRGLDRGDGGQRTRPPQDTSPGASGTGQGLDRGRTDAARSTAAGRRDVNRDFTGGTDSLAREGQERTRQEQVVASPGASGSGQGLDRGDGAQTEEEQFGDLPIFIGGSLANAPASRPPGGGSGATGTRLETVLGQGAEAYSSTVDRLINADAPVGGLSVSLDDVDVSDTERSELARNFAESGTRTAAELGNVPGVALGLKEGAEFVGYGVSETVSGRGGEFAAQTGTAAEETVEAGVEYAQENPGRAAGSVAGSLVASTAAMGAASAVSSRAGLASRVAIQPGEEALGYGGRAATKALAGRRAADRLFPDNEPLFMSEEAAIRGAKRAGSAAKGTASRTRKILSGDEALSPSPRQAELVDRFRPGSATDINTETGAPGARSEPLGATEMTTLDALYQTESPLESGGARQTMTAGLRSRVSESEFAADTRGQMQVPRGEPSSNPVTEPEISDDRVTPNLYQQSVSRQVRTEYEVREGGDFEGVRDPFTERSRTGRRPTETEIETERATEPELARRTQPLFDVDTRGDQEPLVDPVGEPMADPFAGPRADQEPDQRPDVMNEPREVERGGREFESFIETETETELRSPFETEFETETETETELEAEFRTREVEFDTGDRRTRRDDDVLFGSLSGDRRRIDRDLLNPFTGT